MNKSKSEFKNIVTFTTQQNEDNKIMKNSNKSHFKFIDAPDEIGVQPGENKPEGCLHPLMHRCKGCRYNMVPDLSDGGCMLRHKEYETN